MADAKRKAVDEHRGARGFLVRLRIDQYLMPQAMLALQPEVSIGQFKIESEYGRIALMRPWQCFEQYGKREKHPAVTSAPDRPGLLAIANVIHMGHDLPIRHVQ